MRYNNFELEIGGRYFEKDGYVGMKHGDTYTIYLYNHTNLRVNAKVKVDGKSVGDFRVRPFGSIALERPSNDTGQFTFYRQHSEEANLTGLHSVESLNLGVISVTFVPEKRVQQEMQTRGMTRSASLGGFESTRSKGMGAGGTGLSGESNQKFVQAVDIVEDWDKAVTINLRLVEDLSGPKPLRDTKETPIPPPVK